MQCFSSYSMESGVCVRRHFITYIHNFKLKSIYKLINQFLKVISYVDIDNIITY